MRKLLVAAPSLALLLSAAAAAVHPTVAQAQASCLPGRVMVVLDKSSSMRTGSIAGRTKWSIAVDALGTVLTEFETKAEFGLMTFPRPNQCSPGGLDVAPALANRDEVMAALSTPPPTAGNWTPMAQTLEVAATEPSIATGDMPRSVVLISDGWQWCSPYDPATRFDGSDAIANLNAAGITTYVVGFGAEVDAGALNQMAALAGTARPGCNPNSTSPADPNNCYFQADDAQDLIDALRDIAGDVTTEVCDGIDNDCDGLIDEDLVRSCGTACGNGTETCTAGSWGGCDAPVPQPEVCDGLDNNCDGTTDPGCECLPGQTRPCGETSTVGACQPGTQTCSPNGAWGQCDGSVGPSPEVCDGIDNDCNGDIDNPVADDGEEFSFLCDPGLVCVDGMCQPMDPVLPPDDESDPAFDDDGAPAGCGCRTHGDGAGAVVMLGLGAMLFGLRRRRR
ncbi:MAG: VWA domain-containing protein [Kofleriaceae bacterium]|nr:VWA domain-containing protein [Kofleriaceae bacterium]